MSAKNKSEIISQGAEAVLTKKDNQTIIKHRIKKSYRIPELDEKIRKHRTKSEAKLIAKASAIIPVPNIIKVDEKTKEIHIDLIYGELLSKHLNNFPLEKQKLIARAIGESIAKLHKEDIIHGDLTTSNMICDSASLHTLCPKVYFIDFGLGFISRKIEDKAIDLHLLKQALQAGHYKTAEQLFIEIRKGYAKVLGFLEAQKTFERIKAIEKRGRYKG